MDTAKKQYDILELHKMEIGELYNVALWYGVDTLNKYKQPIIYEILEAQTQFNKQTNE